MIYVCIPTRDEAPTVGLVLWKTRKVFGEFGREYQLLVMDDGSVDTSGEVLGPYAKVLPLTVRRNETGQGYARSIEALLREAVTLSDRPKRDCAVLMHADFAHGPAAIPELVKHIDSGADLVVAESRLEGEPSRGRRLVRRWAPTLLGAKVPGVRDAVSGFLAVRLSTLKLALRDGGPLLATDGWAANAELLLRLARHARRTASVSVVERHDLRPRPSRIEAWPQAKALWRARATLRATLREAT